jgi:inorganic pyrophosphatase
MRAQVIGYMHMIDSGETDRKIIAVAADDIAWNFISDIGQLPPHTTKEIQRFFEDYKILENKSVLIEEFGNTASAMEVIAACRENYRHQFSGKE